MKKWKDAILGRSTAGRVAMVLFALLVLVVFASVAFGNYGEIPAKPVTREQYHDFVQHAKEAYGPNRRTWPEGIERIRAKLFESYMNGRVLA